jgi:hypothetical protein
MKKTILFFIWFTISLQVFSQTFTGGFVLGVCGSQVDGDEQSGYKKPGLIAGAYVKTNFSEFAALKIETYYVGKGAVLNIDQGDGILYQQFNTNLHYVEMPFLFDMAIHSRINIAVGIAPSYLFKHKLSRDRIVVPEDTYSLKNFDFQPTGQVDFYLTDHISSSLRFGYSMLNIREDELAGWFNNNVAVVLRFNI